MVNNNHPVNINYEDFPQNTGIQCMCPDTQCIHVLRRVYDPGLKLVS